MKALRLHRAAFAVLAAFACTAGSCNPQAPPDTAVVLCAAAATASEESSLASLREKAESRGAVRVIVRVAAPEGGPSAPAAMQRMAQQAFRRAGVAYVEPLSPRLPYVVAEVTLEQIDALYSDARFPAWSEDRVAVASLAESGPLVEAPRMWEIGARGAGQAVAILDTGVDSAHPFLAGRVVSEACFSTTSPANGATTLCPNGQASQTGAGAGRPCREAGCEHGTHVAGIAAGRGEDFSGMAPDADLIAIQVFSRFSGAQCGGGTCIASFTSDQIRALDFVLQLSQTRAVASANMSLGGGRSGAACDNDPTKPVIDQLRAAGIATVIASGNDGFRDAVSFPGCISSAVTVGATDKQDRLAPFSNCGPQVDLHAPGVNINSSLPGGRFGQLSGTSMATPHVAGAFAALRSRASSQGAEQIEAALRSSGLNTGGPRIRLRGAADALPAVSAEAQMTSGTTPPNEIAALAALPQDQPQRFIVQVASGSDLARVEAAARAAGASYVGNMGSQNMLTIEATPAQARALAQTSGVTSVQLDRPARPQ